MTAWYRLGDGTLGIDSEDAPLADRFETIYGGCRVDAPGEGVQVTCRVRLDPTQQVVVHFDDPEPLDAGRFIAQLFPDRGYTVTASARGASVRLPGSMHEMELLAGTVRAPVDSEWRPLVANLAISRLMRLQRDVVFFHAASVRMGARGLLACGPKRSGKTTLALGLAARGHHLLGDETAAVRLSDRTLLPFRRSLAARAGPSSTAAAALLAGVGGVAERFPDGETRTRLAADAVSAPGGIGATPLTTLVILRRFVPTTQVRPAARRPELLGALTPLAASLWDRSAGEVTIRLLRLLAAIRVFEVDAGPPDEMVARMELLMEDG